VLLVILLLRIGNILMCRGKLKRGINTHDLEEDERSLEGGREKENGGRLTVKAVPDWKLSAAAPGCVRPIIALCTYLFIDVICNNIMI
jgi:hypothetical protein